MRFHERANDQNAVTSSTRTIGGQPLRRPKSNSFLLICLVAITFACLSFAALNLSFVMKTGHQIWVGGKDFLFGTPKPLDGITDSQKPIQSQTAYAKVESQDVRLLTAAADALNQDIKKDASNATLQNQLGIIYAQMGEFPAAIDHFQTAIDVARLKASELSAQARSLSKTGNTEGASDLVRECSQLHVELSAAHSNLARVYDKLGMHDKVVAQLDQLNSDIAFSSDFSRPKEAANPFIPEKFAVTAEGVKDHRMSTQAAAILARAQALMQARRISEAVREYKRLLRLDPQISLAHQQLGLCAVMLGDVSTAKSEFQMAVRLDPADANSHNDLGMTMLSTGDPHAAQMEFNKALNISPKHLDAAINLANILASEGQLGDAERILERALVANPNSAIAHNNLATVESINGKPNSAVKEFRAALGLNPSLASAHYGLGLALLDVNSYQPAIKEFKTALALNPALTDAHNKIEQAYRKSEQSGIGPGAN
jgi:tetratricopeptide (TPR) repeat protein